jgi:hypothetical protein
MKASDKDKTQSYLGSELFTNAMDSDITSPPTLRKPRRFEPLVLDGITDIKADFIGNLVFQSELTPRSLESTGTVYADVDSVTGGFSSWIGDNQVTIEVPIYNARNTKMTLNENGFQLVVHNLSTPVDFYDKQQVLTIYYEAVGNYVKQVLNAHKVYCFDHIVRNSGVSMQYSVKDGQTVGGPFSLVHGDYSLQGGPVRMHNFGRPPMLVDSFRELYGERPLISAEEMEELKGRRFAIINLWRSITDDPCVDMPLALCDTQTTQKTDYSTIEWRYSDRTIEAYLGGYSQNQRWFYYPAMHKNEGILLKTYDSQGALFEDFNYPYRLQDQPLIPSTAVLHSAVQDPRLDGQVYSKRESIEVRTIVFY